MQYIAYLFIGLILGIANIIPGVSGGTMAVVFNIYDKLIGALSNFKKDIKGNIAFLLPILVGAGIGILAFASLITYLLEFHFVPTNYFFVGLIIGSVPLILKKVKGTGAKVFTPRNVVAFAVGFGVMLIMVLTKAPDKQSQPMLTPTMMNYLLLVCASALAAAAMIIPGISGSFLMLIIGTYTTVTGSISAVLDMIVALFSGDMATATALVPTVLMLIPVAIGILIGLLGGAKVIEKLLIKYEQATYACILGLVLGSALVIAPAIPTTSSLIISVVTLLVGTAMALVCSPRVK